MVVGSQGACRLTCGELRAFVKPGHKSGLPSFLEGCGGEAGITALDGGDECVNTLHPLAPDGP